MAPLNPRRRRAGKDPIDDVIGVLSKTMHSVPVRAGGSVPAADELKWLLNHRHREFLILLRIKMKERPAPRDWCVRPISIFLWVKPSQTFPAKMTRLTKSIARVSSGTIS